MPRNYEDFEQMYEPTPDKDRGGKYRKTKSKTSSEARSEQRENARRQRVAEAKKRVDAVVESLVRKKTHEEAEELMVTYVRWVNDCIRDRALYLDPENDIVFEDFKSSGPGGQNVNKVSTGIRARHVVSGIYAKSTDSRDQYENRNSARTRLIERLDEHISEWRVVLTDGNNANEPRQLSADDLVNDRT